MGSSEIMITVFIAMGVVLLFMLSRAQSKTRRRHELSRSNARVVREVKRIAVRHPERIIETHDGSPDRR